MQSEFTEGKVFALTYKACELQLLIL